MKREKIKQAAILNLIQNFRRLLWSFRNSVHGRFQIKFGITPYLNNSAFTLIELLVVVLIIAILAAIALPQYQKAVEKSRLAEALQVIQVAQKCYELFQLEHGNPSDTLALNKMDCPIELPIALQQNGNGESYFSTLNFDYMIWADPSGGMRMEIFRTTNSRDIYTLIQRLDGRRTCYATNNSIGQHICNFLQKQGWEYNDDAY